MIHGKLYIVPMPIGNDKDITLRAISLLQEVDFILAEDTRDAKVILSKYQITTPMLSYHLHNEKERLSQITEYLYEGKDLALISDAGTPLISDPGYLIVKHAIDLNVRVVALPGANAGLTALVASGLNPDQFIFIGFIPKKGSERNKQLANLCDLPYTFILYEAPHRILKTLAELCENDLADRKISVARELTKKYETYIYTDIKGANQYYQKVTPRGEFVLVVEGKLDYLDRTENSTKQFLDRSAIENDVKELLEGGMKVKSISSYLSKRTEFSKNEIYQLALELDQKSQ
ncbi:MAG: 16S rRNA (cytidine(1402)-2'-O)-methyltransferase [Clostridiaceae bacterium]|nr:16S rRNA (cytidine(1402)-2'-O)-methyltransferase [Clostridiaceae bacterium]